MKKEYLLKLIVDVPSERSAGIIGFTDEIEIKIKSGDPRGEPGEFEEFIKECLAEWYDVIHVYTEKEYQKIIKNNCWHIS